MELRHLRCFLALADELHFNRAARRLGLSQPPLTVAIQQLEAEVGAPLFLRNSRGVQLTAAGQALVPAARAALDQAAQALNAARDGAAGQLGRVNTNGRTVYQGRYLLAWKSRPSSSHVLNIAFPPNAATSA